MTIPNRIADLLAQSQVTGIDFIYVHPDQMHLDVYFLRSVTTLDPPLPITILPENILIYSSGTALPFIEIETVIGWTSINNQDVLQLKTEYVGDFTLYNFKILSDRIDSFFNDVSFSFKANCPSDLDCCPPAHECPADTLVDFPVDYLARDFWSYRTALLDFAALRYPDWADRLEADGGIMMAEVMSALGDEMAYYQDKVSRESYLETSTQRRSIRKHARLIDYNLHDGLGAKVWLDVTAITLADNIPAGSQTAAIMDNGKAIDFEIGHNLLENIKGKNYLISSAINELAAHIWDEDELCLPVGTTELYLAGHHQSNLVFDDFLYDLNKPGKWVLIQTKPTNPAQTARNQIVRLTKVENTKDEVFNTNITYIAWEQEHALLFEFALAEPLNSIPPTINPILTIRGNILPATAGKTESTHFVVKNTLGLELPFGSTINRIGHNGANNYLFSLPKSNEIPLVFLGENTQENLPEIFLEEGTYDVSTQIFTPIAKPVWEYRKTLVGVVSSNPDDPHFSLDDGTWSKLVTYYRLGKEITHEDYAQNNGFTIRFGDGEFGKVPNENSFFRVKYRIGGGRRSNVAAQIITKKISNFEVNNYLPAIGGLDAETYAELRQQAPEAYQSVTYRAVRPEDYAEAAERLPWVQKAGAAFRWTGSWLTAFVTPDPKDKVILEEQERKSLNAQLNRFRQAGRETNVMDPLYADIDLKIEICVDENSYAGQVKERVQKVLMGKKGIRPIAGYFSPDRFTFGTALDRSTLEAAIQKVEGVKAVERIDFRRKSWFGWRQFTEMTYNPGLNTIIRISNDPLHPNRGSFNLYTHGGI